MFVLILFTIAIFFVICFYIVDEVKFVWSVIQMTWFSCCCFLASIVNNFISAVLLLLLNEIDFLIQNLNESCCFFCVSTVNQIKLIKIMSDKLWMLLSHVNGKLNEKKMIIINFVKQKKIHFNSLLWTV